MQSANSDDVRRALKSTFLFATLSEEQLGSLAEQVWIERIPSGSVIVREGDEAESLYVVVEGGVNVLKGSGQFLAFLGPGGFFGEMALFMDQSKRSATCQATVDTTCVVVRKHVLEQFCNTRSDAGLVIYRAIIRTLAERLQNTSADLAYLMGVHVRHQSTVSAIVETRPRVERLAAGLDEGRDPLGDLCRGREPRRFDPHEIHETRGAVPRAGLDHEVDKSVGGALELGADAGEVRAEIVGDELREVARRRPGEGRRLGGIDVIARRRDVLGVRPEPEAPGEIEGDVRAEAVLIGHGIDEGPGQPPEPRCDREVVALAGMEPTTGDDSRDAGRRGHVHRPQPGGVHDHRHLEGEGLAGR